MQPYEILNATKLWKNCNDMRPWLIVEMREHGVFGCFPISGECYDPGCFCVPQSDPDFPATGLSKTSYIYDAYIVEIGIDEFDGKKRGELTGALLERFRRFAGL